MRGVSLDEIAAATKIGTRSLTALEEENFAILPGGIFNKGFVRAYARFLGMNEDQAVADYQAAANDQPVSVRTIATQSAMAKANRLAAQQAREASGTVAMLRAVVFVGLAIAIAFGGYKAYRHGIFKALKRPSLHRQMKQQAQASTILPASPTVPSVSPPALPATASSAAPVVSAAIAPPLPAEFTVSIKTSETSWLSVVADGKPAFHRLFAPNEEQSITAKEQVTIKIGNPGGTELSLNGKPLAIGGDLTHPRTVTVGASGLANQ
jgi:cytoskeleton protein RodZ